MDPPDENRGPLILGWLWTTAGLATIVVVLRAYVRIKTRAQGWDDYFSYIALINVVSALVATTIQVRNGFGRHLVYVLPKVSFLSEWTTITELQNATAVLFVKISVCLFILRVIGRTHRKMAYSIYFLMALITVFTLVSVLTIVLQCRPFKKVWEPSIKGTCINPNILVRLVEVYSAIGCITDFSCVLIPILIFRSLQLKKTLKIALSCVIALGLMYSFLALPRDWDLANDRTRPAVCAIGKCVTVGSTSGDLTWDLTPAEIWSGMEANVGLIVACMPALRCLFYKVLGGETTNVSNGARSGSKKFSSFLKVSSKSDDRPSPQESFQQSTIGADRKGFIRMGEIKRTRSVDIDSEVREHEEEIFPLKDQRGVV